MEGFGLVLDKALSSGWVEGVDRDVRLVRVGEVGLVQGGEMKERRWILWVKWVDCCGQLV